MTSAGIRGPAQVGNVRLVGARQVVVADVAIRVGVVDRVGVAVVDITGEALGKGIEPRRRVRAPGLAGTGMAEGGANAK